MTREAVVIDSASCAARLCGVYGVAPETGISSVGEMSTGADMSCTLVFDYTFIRAGAIIHDDSDPTGRAFIAG
jgi:hypothetical protein